MKNLTAFIFSIFCTIALFAQNPEQVPFNGLIVDSANKGIKARILIKDSSLETNSDKQGRFGFTKLNDDDVLIIKYKKTEIEVPVEGRKSIKIRILENNQVSSSFEPELVDLGYGYVNKREMTNTSRGITGELFERGIYKSLADAIQNIIPGAKISEDGEHVMLRGLNSLVGDSYALILLDGIEIPGLSDVNVFDIENIEVSSDGAMYGVRGGNGVINIKTK